MPNILDTVQISGNSYDLKDKNAPSVSAVTQQEYDNLPSSAKTSNTFFVISDAQAGDLSQYWTSAQTNSAITEAVSGKQDTLISRTNIKTINNESILGSGNIDIQGGGKAVSGGTNISITTGETADTINCTLPIYINQYDGRGDINIGTENNANSDYYRIAIGRRIEMSSTQGSGSIAIGVADSNSLNKNKCYGGSNVAIGRIFQIGESDSYSGARHGCVVIGNNAKSLINSGVAIGAGTTVSGTTKTNINNQLTIDTSNQVYIYNKDNTEMICLQDHLGGGGVNVVQTTGTSTTDVMSQDAVTTQLSGYVTTDTLQNITAQKTFVGDPSNRKKSIKFKQYDNASKVGFVVVNSAETNNEVASFEFRPNTFTIDNVQHPLLYFGHYRNTSIANAGVPQTVIGFRQYDQLNAAAYHYLMPLPEKAKTPFSLTTSFKDYYAPMGFKNGSTMITADDTGVVDLSSELGGLKLVKLTQSEYDALVTKDDNTVYFIGDATNGYTMKIGSANVN